MTLGHVLAFVIGFCAGWLIISGAIVKLYMVGKLVVDTHNPEKDIFELKLDVPPAEMVSKKYVMFQVKHDLNSQEKTSAK